MPGQEMKRGGEESSKGGRGVAGQVQREARIRGALGAGPGIVNRM